MDNPILQEMQQVQDTSSDNPILNSMGYTPPSSQATGNGSSSWDNFKQMATQIATQRGFPLSVLLGQAALESGYGTSNFARNRNNYFGYEAYDSNPDNAKAYANPSESINDYINLITNSSRYSGAYAQYLQDKNPLTLLQGIKNGGYATDPNYVTKVASTPEFQQYSKEGL